MPCIHSARRIHMIDQQKKRILVGISGGLDSAYTAMMYRDMGYEVYGATLRMSAQTDVAAAQKAAAEIGIPLFVVDMERQFEEFVKSYFAHAYARGETPNPCVMCNRYVKIEGLCRCAEEHGIDRVSTGHYARIRFDEVTGRYYAAAADDRRKDQSYMLWMLTQKQLSMLETPLADRDKTGIREEAHQRGLSAASSKESQDICFLPGGDYVSFVEARCGAFPPGDFIDETGVCVGKHAGIIRYTVGQRKGLGIALGHPVFVTRIDADTNTVHLAPTGGEYMERVTITDPVFQWMSPDALQIGLSVAAKIRYAAKPAAATVETIKGSHVTLRFSIPQRAVTPGQSCVCYDAETGSGILFGGRIV